MRGAARGPVMPLAGNPALGGTVGLPAGMRPPTGGGLLPVGMRPPTGSTGAGGRPQSGAFRPPTGSGGGPPGTSGGANLLNQAVNVVARPVTAAGLAGQNGGPATSGRQIADKNYYINELRTKLASITSESTKLVNEEQQIGKDAVLYTTLERRYDTVMGTVRHLEGELADYNLAMDKLRTHTSATDISTIYSRLKERNHFDREQTDEIFVECGEMEAEIADIEREMKAIEAESAAALRVLGDDKVQEFELMTAECRDWKDKRQDIQSAEIHQQAQIANAKTLISSPVFVMQHEAISLLKQIEQHHTRLDSLVSDLDLSRDSAGFKERLTSRIKSETDAVRTLEQRQAELTELIEAAQVAVNAAEQEKENKMNYAAKTSKYEAIYERDRKMTEFLDLFEGQISQLEQEREGMEVQIVASMQQIATEQGHSADLSTGDINQLNEATDNVTFKAEKQKNNMATLAVLEREKEKREEELEKIGQLDTKIAGELVSLRQEMIDMKKKQEEFKDENQWKEFHANEKKRLSQLSGQLRKEREEAATLNAPFVEKLKSLQQQLHSLDNYSHMQALESELQTISAQVFELNEAVQTRHRETDYSKQKAAVLTLVTELNDRHCKMYAKQTAAPQA